MSTEELYCSGATGKQKLLGSPARLGVNLRNSNSDSMEKPSFNTPTASSKRKTVVIGKGNYMKGTESSKLSSIGQGAVHTPVKVGSTPQGVADLLMSGGGETNSREVPTSAGNTLATPTRLSSSIGTPGSANLSSSNSSSSVLSPSSSVQQLNPTTPPRAEINFSSSSTGSGSKLTRSSLSHSSEKRSASAGGSSSKLTRSGGGVGGYAKSTVASIAATKRTVHAKPRAGAGAGAGSTSMSSSGPTSSSGSQAEDGADEGTNVTESLLMMTPTRRKAGGACPSGASGTSTSVFIPSPARKGDRYGTGARATSGTGIPASSANRLSSSTGVSGAGAGASGGGRPAPAWNNNTSTNTTTVSTNAPAIVATSSVDATPPSSASASVASARRVVATGSKSGIPVVRKNHPYLRQQQLQLLLHGSNSNNSSSSSGSGPGSASGGNMSTPSRNTPSSSASASANTNGVSSSPSKSKREKSENSSSAKSGTANRKISSNTSTTITTLLLPGSKRSVSGSTSAKTGARVSSSGASAATASIKAKAAAMNTNSAGGASSATSSAAAAPAAGGAAPKRKSNVGSAAAAAATTTTTGTATTSAVPSTVPARRAAAAIAFTGPTRPSVPPVPTKEHRHTAITTPRMPTQTTTTAATTTTTTTTTSGVGNGRMPIPPTISTARGAVSVSVSASASAPIPAAVSVDGGREAVRTPTAGLHNSPSVMLTSSPSSAFSVTSPSSAFSVNKRTLQLNSAATANVIVPIIASGQLAKATSGEDIALSVPVARRVVRGSAFDAVGGVGVIEQCPASAGDSVGACTAAAADGVPSIPSLERQNSDGSCCSIPGNDVDIDSACFSLAGDSTRTSPQRPLSPSSSTMARCRALSDLNVSMRSQSPPESVAMTEATTASASASSSAVGSLSIGSTRPASVSPRVVPVSPRSHHLRGNSNNSLVNLTASILPVSVDGPVMTSARSSSSSSSSGGGGGGGGGVLAGRTSPRCDRETAMHPDEDREVGYCLSQSTSNNSNSVPSSRPQSVASTNYTNSSILSAIYPNTEDGEEGSYGFFDGNNMSMSPRSLLTTPQSVLFGPQSSVSTVAGSHMSPLTYSSVPHTASASASAQQYVSRFSPLPLQHSIVDAFQRQFSDNNMDMMGGGMGMNRADTSRTHSSGMDVTVRLNDLQSSASPNPSETASLNPNNVAVIYYDGDGGSEAASVIGDSEMGFYMHSEAGSRPRSVLQETELALDSNDDSAYDQSVRFNTGSLVGNVIGECDTSIDASNNVDTHADTGADVDPDDFAASVDSSRSNENQSGIEISTSLGEISGIMQLTSSNSTVNNGNWSALSMLTGVPSSHSRCHSHSQFELGSSSYESVSGSTSINENNLTIVSRTGSVDSTVNGVTAACNSTHLLSITTCNDGVTSEYPSQLGSASASASVSANSSSSQLLHVTAATPAQLPLLGTTSANLSVNSSTHYECDFSSSSAGSGLNDSTNGPLSPMVGSPLGSPSQDVQHPRSSSITREDSDPLADSLEYVQH